MQLTFIPFKRQLLYEQDRSNYSKSFHLTLSVYHHYHFYQQELVALEGDSFTKLEWISIIFWKSAEIWVNPDM